MVHTITICSPARMQITPIDPSKLINSMYIFDARSKMAAIGNKIVGSGYENPANYPFANIIFGDIANIHAVRESYIKLNQICSDSKYFSLIISCPKFYSAVDKSDWLQHVATILKFVNLIVKSIRVLKLVKVE